MTIEHETFQSLDEALHAFQLPLENRDVVRGLLTGASVTRYWIPPCRQYVAAAPATGAVVAYVLKGAVEFPAGGGTDLRVELPVTFPPGHGHRRPTRSERPTVLCPVHGLELPATGLCDDCG